MSKFILLITLLIPEYETKVISLLLNMGFGVGLPGMPENYIFTLKNENSCILGLEIENKNNVAANSILPMIKEKLRVDKISYHSIVMVYDARTTWGVGTIHSPESPQNGSPYRQLI